MFCAFVLPIFGQGLYELLDFHPKSWEGPQKPLEYFYDQHDIKLNIAHDTLDIFILGHKKVSYRWHDVNRQRDFNGWFGFEKDVQILLEKLETIGLDFERQNYHIIFSPESDEMRVSPNQGGKFAKIGDDFLPTLRHQITLTYYSYLMEVDFFLGEIDELEVLKNAGINDMVKSAALENNWYDHYKKRNLNKVLLIDDEGEISLDTYYSRENPYYPKTNLDLGVGYLFGNSLSMFFQPRYNIRLRTPKNYTLNNTLYFAFSGNLSHIPQREASFEVAHDYFLGIGVESDQLGNELAFTLGYRVFGNNGILNEFPYMYKFEYAIIPKLKISHAVFHRPFSRESRRVNLVGISYMIF
ncbi:MAG: hypothetical protein EA341_00540 [Mongoliibacter sp.]|nr:MAG: hypothetical protein EA341_00540 [Mongoliibacter sp.]